MASYTVTINIDPSWVTTFDQNGYELIMAKATQDGSGKEVYDVVASTQTVTPQMTVSWTDSYKITGTTQSFQPGNTVDISGVSGLEQIEFGQTYYLTDWAHFSVAADPRVPGNGFGFQNTPPAAVMVEFEIGNNWIPVYMSTSNLPPGLDKLVPLPKVVFWFQQNLTTGTMISLDMSNVCEVDLTGSPTATITYNGQGQWVQDGSSAALKAKEQKAIDYTKVKPART